MTTYSYPGAIADVVGTTGRIEATWGNAVRDRVINSFASTAARDAAITSPSEGHLCYVTADDAYYWYSGAAWYAHDTVAQNMTVTISQNVGVTFTATRVKMIRRFKWVDLAVNVALTSAGTASQPMAVNLPAGVTAAAAGQWCGSGIFADASGLLLYPFIAVLATTTGITFTDSTQATAPSVYLGAPGTAFNAACASGDSINLTASYELA